LEIFLLATLKYSKLTLKNSHRFMIKPNSPISALVQSCTSIFIRCNSWRSNFHRRINYSRKRIDVWIQTSHATYDGLATNTIRGKVYCRRCDVVPIIVMKKISPLSRENFALLSRLVQRTLKVYQLSQRPIIDLSINIPNI
jgi:hypothetical protein